MKFKKLQPYVQILDNPSFSYIADPKRISELLAVVEALRFQSDTGKSKTIFETYLNNLRAWYDKFNSTVPDLRNGYLKIGATLQLLIAVIEKSQTENIPRGKIHSFMKTIKHGLNGLTNGLRVCFDPDIISTTVLSQEQIVKYLFNKEIGLARKFKLNTIGDNCPVRVLPGMSREEVIQAVKYLSKGDFERKGGWNVYGRGQRTIRVVTTGDRVYAVFKSQAHDNQKGPYMEMILRKKPSNLAFQQL
ncbi:hypothetical protein HYX12_02775 [Candidatus Woesearchaeota archaeon]|nr:hypothetical protein [Candidatus Woesearchaeota archaeon]